MMQLRHTVLFSVLSLARLVSLKSILMILGFVLVHTFFLSLY